ncbi:39S ribosomal protein L15, mitochondrial-like [Oppia nitens]|uniref:39S ribosomal protein L15, mitochondrial-like n=1 Tax=Oppia nitens TaxID=1686743 RepID=UPI0023DBFDE5|nr:39S ribosomal protein L15, mitochondrial-like [Oppia nitens]
MSNPTEKALQLLRYLPRVSHNNLSPNPYFKKKTRKVGQYLQREKINHSNRERQRYWPVGYEGGRTPFYLKIPIENYYKNHKYRRQYPPLTLFQLQLMIDNGAINPSEPIDLTNICNTNFYRIEPQFNHFGCHLTDEGINEFKAKVNIEVQYVREPVIAAIERNGGVITSAYYDINSIIALYRPIEFFKKGEPIPKRLLPTVDLVEYYTDPKNRGYLADPVKVEEERKLLAQKYGYELPDNSVMSNDTVMRVRKDPRQVFFGLEPGWVVNLKDKQILRPTDPDLVEYYRN